MPSSQQVGGAQWETDCERYLNQHGFPGVQRERVRHPDLGDLGGMTEWTIECSGIASGSGADAKFSLPRKVNQARAARINRGTPWLVVLRKQKFKPVDRGFAIMEIGQWASLAVLLDGCRCGAERSA